MDHVAFIRPGPLEQLVRGTKEYEVRLSKRKTRIWQCSEGDRVFLKESGGPIKYVATAAEVVRFNNLTPQDIQALHGCVGSHSSFGGSYFERHKNANYAVLIKFSGFRRASMPDQYTPKGVQMGWVTGYQHGDQYQDLSQNTAPHLAV